MNRRTLFRLLSLVCLLSVEGLVGVVTSAPVPDEGKIKESYYDILGIGETATAKEIKKGYRKQALLNHPDKVQDGEDVEDKNRRFVQIANAYEVLSDEKTKAEYDQMLARGVLEFDDNFAFDDARKMYEAAEAADFREMVAGIISFGLAGLIACVPFYRQWKKKWDERQNKKEALANLQERSQLVSEVQQERERAKKATHEKHVEEIKKNIERMKEFQRLRAEAEEEQEDSSGAEGGEIKAPVVKQKASKEATHGCDICKKKFKSEKQRDNHFQSNAHKKAAKAAVAKEGRSKDRKKHKDEYLPLTTSNTSENNKKKR